MREIQREERPKSESSLAAVQSPPRIAAIVGLLTLIGGCGGGVATPTPSATAPSNPQSYLAPFVAGDTTRTRQTYAIDDVNTAFTETSFDLSTTQEGAQILNAGTFTPSSRGLINLSVSATYSYNSDLRQWIGLKPSPPMGGFALELSGQAGALIQLGNQPVQPLVPAKACPNFASSKSFNYLTIPAPFPTSDPAQPKPVWNPATETAYGTIDISTSGSTVSLKNSQQFTFPLNGATGSLISRQGPPPDAVCGITAYGNTISIPGQVVVSKPGNGNTSPPQAIANIGPTGLLVEDNGVLLNGSSLGTYETALGAGTGAVGLPSAAVDTGVLASAQYLGFVYGTSPTLGVENSATISSHPASFGFSADALSRCSSLSAAIPAKPGHVLVYGGDFPSDNPSSFTDGFGNCDLALDLGAQDSRPGLFPAATVWMLGYADDTTKTLINVPAVAIAGKLGDKSAIFVLGVDPKSNNTWSIYLFQSN